MYKIPDDVYWLPSEFQGKNMDDKLEDILGEKRIEMEKVKQFEEILQEVEVNKQIIEDEIHIEDEILQQLGITEDDLIVESVFMENSLSQEKYIDRLIEDCLRSNIEQKALPTHIEYNNELFMNQYCKSYLSLEDANLSINSSPEKQDKRHSLQDPQHINYNNVLDYINEQELVQPGQVEEQTLAYDHDFVSMDQFYFKSNDQLQSEFFKLKGQPRCLAFNGRYYSIGTSLGQIMLTDKKITNTFQFKEECTVSHIRFSQNEYLLAGNIQGSIIIYNFNTNKTIKQIQIHKSAILDSVFYLPQQFLSSSSKGLLTLSKLYPSTFGWSTSNSVVIEKPISPVYQLVNMNEMVGIVTINDVQVVKISGVELQSQFQKRYEGFNRLQLGYNNIDKFACGIDNYIEVFNSKTFTILHTVTLNDKLNYLAFLDPHILFCQLDISKYALINQQPILQDYFSIDIATQNFIGVELGQYPISYINTIAVHKNNVLVLQKYHDPMKMLFLYQATLANAQEYIQKKVELMQMNQALTVILAIQENKQKVFANLPLKPEFIKSVINLYLQQPTYIKMITAIDLLTKCQLFDILFQLNDKPYFYSCVTNFIPRLTHVPKNALIDLLDHLQKENKIMQMKQLVLNLQYQDVVQICIQYKLLTLLAFVCPDEDDYLTPIVNLYATKADDLDGYRCLWYIDYCFKNNKGLKDLIQWLTSTDSLSYFLQLNYSQTLVTLLHLFNYKQSQQVNPLSLIDEINNNNHHLLFGLWLSEIISLGHQLEFNYLMKGLITAIEHPYVSLQKYNHIEACKILKKEANPGDDSFIFYQKQKMVVDALRKNNEIICKEVYAFEKLCRIGDQSELYYSFIR